MADKIERVLVVTAHPDDSEFGAGGTVAKLAKDGCEITYVIVTNGNKGSGDRTMTPERLAAIPGVELLTPIERTRPRSRHSTRASHAST